MKHKIRIALVCSMLMSLALLSTAYAANPTYEYDTLVGHNVTFEGRINFTGNDYGRARASWTAPGGEGVLYAEVYLYYRDINGTCYNIPLYDDSHTTTGSYVIAQTYSTSYIGHELFTYQTIVSGSSQSDADMYIHGS